MMKQTFIHPNYFEFGLGGGTWENNKVTSVGLHCVDGNKRTIVILNAEDADNVGRMLIAHADYIKKHRPRT